MHGIEQSVMRTLNALQRENLDPAAHNIYLSQNIADYIMGQVGGVPASADTVKYLFGIPVILLEYVSSMIWVTTKSGKLISMYLCRVPETVIDRIGDGTTPCAYSDN